MRTFFFFLLLLVLIDYVFLIDYAQSDEGGCDQGWTEIDDMCYYFDLTSTTSVSGARSRCALLKSRLPIFPHIMEYKKFNETVLTGYPNLKIAIGLQLINNQWTWMIDGKTTENLFWQTGVKAPHNDSGRPCVIRTDSGWQGVHCDKDTGVTTVCQQGRKSLNITEIPCAPLYRFGLGWEHLVTTNMADALARGFILNQTDLMGGPLFAPIIHIPGVTQPLYEVQNPLSSHSSMVNSDQELKRLLTVYNFTLRGVVAYTVARPDLAHVTMRHLSWSSDPPGDTIVSNDEEHIKYMVNWNWKEKDPVYVFDEFLSPGYCRLEKNCTLSEWSQWSNCSAPCGNATRLRNRTLLSSAIGAGYCNGTEEVEECDQGPCPSITYFATVPLTKAQITALEDSGILDSISDEQSLIASLTNSVLPALFASHEGPSHEAGHQLNETIELCMYDDEPCDVDKLFEPRLNPFYGNCFTFNPRENDLNVTRAGPQGGLRLLLRVQQYEYYPCTQTAGFKVYMHPPDEHPFVETFGYNIAPGLVTSMAISMVTVEKKDTPSNPCTDSWNDPFHPHITYYYNGTYTPEGCTRSCLQDYVIRECECADPRYARPSNVTFCSDVEDDLAASKYGNSTSAKALCPDYHQNTSCRKNYLNEAGCACISQCVRTYYDAVVNSAMLLPNSHIEAVACEELNYTADCKERATRHLALLEIYYEELQSTTFHEQQARTIWELLQDVTNMVQNINGFDFFAVFEVGFLIAEVVNLTFFGRGRNRRNMMKSRIPFIRLLADETTMTDILFFLFTFCGSLLFLTLLYSFKIFGIRW